MRNALASLRTAADFGLKRDVLDRPAIGQKATYLPAPQLEGCQLDIAYIQMCG